MKYLILEPNCRFVPNNDYNRKAAWNYHFNPTHYPAMIIENSPMHLDKVIGDQMAHQIQTRMDIEKEELPDPNQDDYWSIDNVIAKQNVPSVL